MTALLEVRNLSVSRRDGARLLEGVSFSLEAGRCLGISGRSGSGKSLTCLALLQLLPAGLSAGGSVRLEGRELIGAPAPVLQAARGRGIAWIPQQAAAAFDPTGRIGGQVLEAARGAFPQASSSELEARMLEAFGKLGLPGSVLRAHPFELSGGMLQRALIALALLLEPQAVIADEPTTALDAMNAREAAALFSRLREVSGASLIIVTHDLALIRALADDLIVLNAGRMAEAGPASLLDHPSSAAARALAEARLALSRRFREAMS